MTSPGGRFFMDFVHTLRMALSSTNLELARYLGSL